MGEPVDTFLKTEELTRPIWAPRIKEFRAVRLKEGPNTFRFAIDSKNPASAGYRLGLDCIGLEKMPASTGDVVRQGSRLK